MLDLDHPEDMLISRGRHLELNRLSNGMVLIDVPVGVGGLRHRLATTAASAIALHARAISHRPRWSTKRPPRPTA